MSSRRAMAEDCLEWVKRTSTRRRPIQIMLLEVHFSCVERESQRRVRRYYWGGGVSVFGVEWEGGKLDCGDVTSRSVKFCC